MKKNLMSPPYLGDSTQQERHQFWQQVIDQYNSSGLTLREFCTRHGVQYDALTRWRHRLKKKDEHNKFTHSVSSGLAEVVLIDGQDKNKQPGAEQRASISLEKMG